MYLQLSLNSLDIFLGMVKCTDYSMQDKGGSSNAMAAVTQDLDPNAMPFTLQEPCSWPLILQITA